jgi:uncharacterized repeat protein (TIGR01451 family)
MLVRLSPPALLAFALCALGAAASPARAHSVPQVQTTKFLAPETLAQMLDRAEKGLPVLQTGDLIRYIVQFSPIENDAAIGVAGYVTDYIPAGAEVVDAAIVQPDGEGGFTVIPPSPPGPMPNGWAQNNNTWSAPFHNHSFDSSGLCQSAGVSSNRCNGSVAMAYADTGIFFSTDPRTAVFTDADGRVDQGVDGYKISPTGESQINPYLNQTEATTHNLWDADQTNAFGSTQTNINGTGNPKSSAAYLGGNRGACPFGAGSAVAGPDTGYPLDNTGNVGPWQRVAYPGSRVGNRVEGPATGTNRTAFGPTSSTYVPGAVTSAGWALSADNPLPAGTNAVRYAVGRLVVGELRYISITLRLTQTPPANGLINNSEVFGGDAAQAAGEIGRDATWRYHVPSVADNNSNLYVLKQIVGVNGQPYDGVLVPPNAVLTYRITFFNTGNLPQHSLVLKDFLPDEMVAGSFGNLHMVSGVDVIPTPMPNPAPGGVVTFKTIDELFTGGGGVLEFDMRVNGSTGDLIVNEATLASQEIAKAATSFSPAIVAQRAYLSLALTAAPSAAKPGDLIDYTLTITNTGFANASSIVATTWLPTASPSGSGAASRFVFQPGSSSTTGLSNVTPGVTSPATSGPYLAENRDQLTWSFGASTLAPGASAVVTFKATVGANVTPSLEPYRSSVGTAYNNGSFTTESALLEVAPVSIGGAIAGRVFEDTGWTAGPGRTLAAAAADAHPLPAVRVELYDAAGAFVRATYTDLDGAYSLAGLPAGAYTVRVATSTAGDADSPPAAGLLSASPATAVPVFSSDGITPNVSSVGGADPSRVDAGPNFGAPLASLATADTVAQAVIGLTLGADVRSDVDLGLSFEAVTNTRPSGQGSLAAFIDNANRIQGPNTARFVIPGVADPLGRPADPGVEDGVAIIALTQALPALTDADTWIAGESQTAAIGDTNPATLGSGSEVGRLDVAFPPVPGPEIEVLDAAGLAVGFDVQAAGVWLTGLAVSGFGDAINSDAHAAIRVGATADGVQIRGCVIGARATALADPGAAMRVGGDAIRVLGADSGLVADSLVAYAAGAGLRLRGGSDLWTVDGTEFTRNGRVTTAAPGVAMESAAGLAMDRIRLLDNGAAGLNMESGTSALMLGHCNIERNGRGAGGSIAGLYVRGNDAHVYDCVIADNHGAGAQVGALATAALFERNDVSANGTSKNDAGAGPTGQIGYDLLAGLDNALLGTAPYVSLNDSGDKDTGGNGQRNYPILTKALLGDGVLTVEGFATAGDRLELHLADGDASGFGEGATWLVALTEGGADDTSTGTATYNAIINGVLQGADTAARFKFALPAPPGVTLGSKLTATGVGGGMTSEFSGRVTIQSACDTDSDGISDAVSASCWAGGPPPAACTAGQTAGCFDNCVGTPNASQADGDGDGIGNSCDCDLDGDGVGDVATAGCWGGPVPPACVGGALSGCLDNCPALANASQADGDLDGVGDACDVCRPGTFGTTCAACPGGQTTPCSGHGTCDDGITGGGLCACEPGFTGPACDQCEPNRFGPACEPCPGGVDAPCSGQGTCDSGIAGAGMCNCEIGFVGVACESCEDDYFGASCDACPGAPGATCADHGLCDDGASGSGECACTVGFTGDGCGECAPGFFGPECAPCPGGADAPCGGQGTCDAGLSGSGVCECAPGRAGEACDACAPGYFGADCAPCPGGAATPCNDQGTCDDGLTGSGVCACDPGFDGEACDPCPAGTFGASCTPCPGGAATPCTGHGTCDEGSSGAGTCACQGGWFGAACEQACACENGGECADGATGDGACTCPPGFGGPTCGDACPDDPAKLAPGACGCGVPDADADGDGALDCADNCPSVENADQADEDGDGSGDACECDADDDGVFECDPADPGGPPAPACTGGKVSGCSDNCVGYPNADQGDADGDSVGDACDCDADGDGMDDGLLPSCDPAAPCADPAAYPGCAACAAEGDVLACLCAGDPALAVCVRDNCPGAPNPDQADQDGDGLGDACDCDVDGDGVFECDPADPTGPPLPVCTGGAVTECRDNCPGTPNGEQADLDGDGVGDLCACDADGDGVFECDPSDPEAEPLPACAAGQTVGCSDNCPAKPNVDQADQDGDGLGDACDCDVDADGVPECDPGTPGGFTWSPCIGGATSQCLDNCPTVPGADQADFDQDGLGDVCDCDADGDGFDDGVLAACAAPDPCASGVSASDCALCAAEVDPKACLCALVPGHPSCAADNCPQVSNVDQADLDGDGLGDACDCDRDGDGVFECDPGVPPAPPLPACAGGASADCSDNCELIANADQADGDGDGVGDACDCDADGDGVPECDPAAPGGPAPPACAGGVTSGCTDNCPGLPNPSQTDLDGDGVGDACTCDADSDGVLECDPADPTGPRAPLCGAGLSENCSDNCEGLANPDQADLDGDRVGDACDCDADGDGLLECDPADPTATPAPPCVRGATTGCSDNCPRIINLDQADGDGDGVGDPCDCDADNDGVFECDPADPTAVGLKPICGGGSFLDCWDNCPAFPNADQADADQNGVADACEGDFDDDQVANPDDNCPAVANPDQLDTDGDGVGDACETEPPAGPGEPVFYGGGGCEGGGAAPLVPLAVLAALGLLAAFRRRRAALLAVLATLMSVLSAQPSSAALPGNQTSFQVEHFEPLPSAPTNILNVSSSRVLPHLKLAADFLVHFASKPFVTARSTSDDATIADTVEGQLKAELGLALGLWRRLELGLSLPLVLHQFGDTLALFDDPAGDVGGFALGDLRVVAKVRLLDPSRAKGFGLALVGSLYAPTGDRDTFNSDGAFRFEPRLVLDWRHKSGVTIAANLGYHIRPRRVAQNVVSDDAVRWGLGLATPSGWERLELFATLWGAVPTADNRDPDAVDSTLSDGATTPVEFLVGGDLKLGRAMRMRLGAGAGLTHGYGAPAWRALASLDYGKAADDADGDGIADGEDACPNVPEDPDDFEDLDGCPDPDDDQDGVLDGADRCPRDPEDADAHQDEDGCADPDNDGDGILDAQDKCPGDAEDADGFVDADGCPDLDNDQDGVPDAIDQCPLVPEDMDGWESEDGCPDPDNDKDGLLDGDDQCPDVPETVNAFKDEDGCPDTKEKGFRITKTHIELGGSIQFATNKAIIRPASFPLLRAAARVIQDQPRITAIRIEGHTDSDGSDTSNLALSKARAQAVVEFLVSEGVASSRLSSDGFGESRPIADNKTKAGKQQNRRTEFRILEVDGQPVTGSRVELETRILE